MTKEEKAKRERERYALNADRILAARQARYAQAGAPSPERKAQVRAAVARYRARQRSEADG